MCVVLCGVVLCCVVCTGSVNPPLNAPLMCQVRDVGP